MRQPTNIWFFADFQFAHRSLALDSGADGCLVSPSMAELAAHLKALVRSRDTRRSGLTDRLASGHP
jgi:DNA-binding response OmpR family regulator